MFALAPYLKRFSIARKIASGYAVSIGIAVLGTGIGLAVGAISEQKAVREYHAAQTEVQLLSDIETKMAHLVLHPEKLLAAAGNQLTIRYVISKYESDHSLLTQNIVDFRELTKEGIIGETDNRSRLLTQLEDFADEHTLWSQAQWSVLGEETTNSFEDSLVDAITSPEWRVLEIQFEGLSEELVFFRNQANVQRNAAFTQWQQARRFRLWAIVVGMALATLLAIILAIYISRTIAKPITKLTDATQRITKDADFEQHITVESHDETASLAESIQQLVSWVQQYTEELQLAKDTLEERVKERTKSLHEAQSQLIQNEKMSSLGQLVAGVAHEINNPVSFIYGNIAPTQEHVQDLLDLIELYQLEYPEPHEAIAERIEDIDLDFICEDLPNILISMHTGANRIKEIVLSLRTFSRMDEAKFKESDLHAGIDSTLMILKHRLKEQPDRREISVIRHYCARPMVRCYAGLLNQVFMNLLANAIDAVEEDVLRGHLTEPHIIITTKIIEHNFTIEIQNNGTPIPMGIQHRLFDPFFTTKEVGKGTGMGLAISYQIVTEKHGGTLVCHSSESGGTKFVVSLPMGQSTIDEPPVFTIQRHDPQAIVVPKVS